MKNVKLTLDEKRLRALQDVGKAASSDDGRLILTGVCIEVTPHNVWAVATDSYMLVVRHIADGDFGTRGTLVVPAKALSDASKQAGVRKSKSKRGHVRPPLARAVTLSSKGIEFETSTGSITVAPHPHHVDGGGDLRFPDWTKLVTDHIKGVEGRVPCEHVTLRTEFVARIGAALGCASEGLQFEFLKGAYSPVLLAPNVSTDRDADPRSFGMLMPLRTRTAERIQSRARAQADATDVTAA